MPGSDHPVVQPPASVGLHIVSDVAKTAVARYVDDDLLVVHASHVGHALHATGLSTCCHAEHDLLV